MKFVKKIDLFGHSLSFEEDKTSFFKTSLCSVISYLILITIIVFGFVLGNEIYIRKNPNLMSGEEIVGRADSEVPLKDFPIILSIIGNFVTPILKDYRSLFNIDLLYINVASNGKISYEQYYGFCDCEVYKFSDVTQEMTIKKYSME